MTSDVQADLPNVNGILNHVIANAREINKKHVVPLRGKLVIE